MFGQFESSKGIWWLWGNFDNLGCFKGYFGHFGVYDESILVIYFSILKKKIMSCQTLEKCFFFKKKILRTQPNTENLNIFLEDVFSYKHFPLEKILHQK